MIPPVTSRFVLAGEFAIVRTSKETIETPSLSCCPALIVRHSKVNIIARPDSHTDIASLLDRLNKLLKRMNRPLLLGSNFTARVIYTEKAPFSCQSFPVNKLYKLISSATVAMRTFVGFSVIIIPWAELIFLASQYFVCEHGGQIY